MSVCYIGLTIRSCSTTPPSAWFLVGDAWDPFVFSSLCRYDGIRKVYFDLASVVDVSAVAQHFKWYKKKNDSHLVARKPKHSEWSRGYLVKQCIRHWLGKCITCIFRLTGIVYERAGSSHGVPSALLSSAECRKPQKRLIWQPYPHSNSSSQSHFFSCCWSKFTVSFALTFPFTLLWASLFFGASQSHIKNSRTGNYQWIYKWKVLEHPLTHHPTPPAKQTHWRAHTRAIQT